MTGSRENLHISNKTQHEFSCSMPMMSSSLYCSSYRMIAAVCVQPDQSDNNNLQKQQCCSVQIFPPWFNFYSNTLKWIPSLRTWRLKSVWNGKRSGTRIIVLWHSVLMPGKQMIWTIFSLSIRNSVAPTMIWSLYAVTVLYSSTRWVWIYH